MILRPEAGRPEDEPPRTCAICDIPLPPGPPPTFCDEHRAVYEARRREGVGTDELDAQWGDTVAIWRDRPPSLESEPQADRLRFVTRRGRWLVFRRGYPTRLPDYLAVDPTTEEVRRLVAVGWNDLLDDLDGIEPAPRQEDAAQYWGIPGPSTPRPPSALDVQDFIRLDRLTQAASMQVYGVAGNPFGLQLASLCFSGSEHIQLIFGTRARQDRRIAFSVSVGSRRYWRRVAELPIPDDWVRELNVHPGLHAFQQLAGSSVGDLPDIPKGLPEHREVAVAVRGVPYAAELRWWPGESRFGTFTLRHGDDRIDGASLGLSVEQLVGLLEGLVELQEHPELVAQYQREADDRWAELQASPQERRVEPELLRFPKLIWPRSRAWINFMHLEVPVEEGEPEEPAPSLRPRSLTLESRTDQPATYVDPFDGSFTLTVPARFALEVVEADSVTCTPSADQRNVVRCVITAEEARLAFTTSKPDAR